MALALLGFRYGQRGFVACGRSRSGRLCVAGRDWIWWGLLGDGRLGFGVFNLGFFSLGYSFTSGCGAGFWCGWDVDDGRSAAGGVQRHLALTAVAATQALLADVIVARVFGASHANSGGRLVADAALKWHKMAISFWTAG